MAKKSIFWSAVLLFTASLSNTAYAQSGSLDVTFSSDGKLTTSVGSGDDRANSIAIQSDGKIVVAGRTNNGTAQKFALVRYNSDGSLDNTFGTGGIVTTSIGGLDDGANAVAIQSDGKIVVAGYADMAPLKFAIARYNSDGSLDNTFGTGGIVATAVGLGGSEARSVAIQNDGKILAAGYAAGSADADIGIVRYNNNGSLDNTFGTGGIVTTHIITNDFANSIAIQSDGKIVVAGATADFALVRYNSDGSLDNTFGTGGMVTTDFSSSDDVAYSVAIQNDGKIVAAGFRRFVSDRDFALARYDTDGSLDNAFNSDGKVATNIGTSNDRAYSILIQSDGKMVVAGYSSSDFGLARYNNDGSLDTTFDTDGKLTTDIGGNSDKGYSMAMQADGKILVAGSSSDGTYTDFSVVRYNNNINTGVMMNAEQNTEIKIYPNPVSGIVNIEWKGNNNAALQVFNLLGEEVLQQQITKNIDFSLSPKGFYFLKLIEGEKIYSRKILIQ